MTFPTLVERYLQTLEGKPSYRVMKRLSREWIFALSNTPTRAEILARQKAICAGDYQPGATKANKELAFIRAACNFGIYQGKMLDGQEWTEGNPTQGIRKFKIALRTRVARLEELRTILHALDFASTEIDKRDRAFYGLLMFTGCRPSEALRLRREHVTKYGSVGCWQKATTKNGRPQEMPIPSQVMKWLEAVPNKGPFYFCHTPNAPVHEVTMRDAWGDFMKGIGVQGLWSYDLRRTVATYMRKYLKQDDSMIQAVLNHHDSRALRHYLHADFDEKAQVVQSYADWLCSIKGGSHADTDTLPHPVQPASQRVQLPDYPR